MIGNILTELIADTITKSILLNEAEGSSEAAKTAKQLGLVYKGFGRYVHPNNPQKVVATVVNGKLVRKNPKFQEPSYTGSEPKTANTPTTTKTTPTTVVNKGDSPEKIPDPYDAKKPTTLANTSGKKWHPSDFEKKALQKDRDLSTELLKAKGPQVLSDIQNIISKYEIERGSAKEEQIALTAKMCTLRDNIMDIIPISDANKIPTNMKGIFAFHKTKQIAYKTVDKYGSLDGAIEAAEKALKHPSSTKTMHNMPLIKKIHSILTTERNILQGNNDYQRYFVNDEPIDNDTVKKQFGI